MVAFIARSRIVARSSFAKFRTKSRLGSPVQPLESAQPFERSSSNLGARAGHFEIVRGRSKKAGHEVVVVAIVIQVLVQLVVHIGSCFQIPSVRHHRNAVAESIQDQSQSEAGDPRLGTKLAS